MIRYVKRLWPGALLVGLFFCGGVLVAEDGSRGGSHSFLDLVKAGGLIGVVIFLLSLWGGAEAIRLLFLLRRERMMPSVLIEAIGQASAAERFHTIPDICRNHPSFLASILLGGLRNATGGWPDTEKGMEETLESETARLSRKTEILALIGNIAPMLGLLGTVIGMVMTFGELAVSEGLGRFANLAPGIYFALVTTVDGLLVAIPALALYAFFNHRIAALVDDAAETAETLTQPLKEFLRKQQSGKQQSVPPVAASQLPPELPRVRVRREEGAVR